MPSLELDEFLTWQFWAATLFVAAAIWFVKLFAVALSPPTLEKAWFKAVLTLANLLFGLAAALVPNYLKGDSFAERAMLGVIVGMMSSFAYNLFVKRLLDRFGANPGGLGGPGGGAPAAPEIPKSERKTPPDPRPAQGP